MDNTIYIYILEEIRKFPLKISQVYVNNIIKSTTII